jgi:uncharacterized membrane protein YfcA
VPGSPWLYILTGAFTGAVGAMLGLGGGVLLVPLLTLGLDVPIRSAIAASLVSVIATASASSTVNLEKGLVNLRLGLALEVATTLGGLAGGLASSLLTTRQLFLLFAFTLGTMSLAMVRRSGRRNVIADLSVEPGPLGGSLVEDGVRYVYRVRRLGVAYGSSLVAGALSGLLGVGGGIIKVPILNTFCGIPIRVAASTSAFMIGVTAAASGFVYYGRGDLDLPLAGAVALGALPASLLGARLSHRVETRWLKLFMAAILAGVAVQMAWGSR